MAFHLNCGKRIKLSNGNRTASRNVTEFNHGLVLSTACLVDDILFEVRIDEKVCIYSHTLFEYCWLNNSTFILLSDSFMERKY